MTYPGGQVQVEAGAIEIAYDSTMRLPEGEYRIASDWRSLWRLTVAGDTAQHPVVITAATNFTRCWALAEMLIDGDPLEAVTRAAGRQLEEGDIEISQGPGAVSSLASGAAWGRAQVTHPKGAFPARSYVLRVTGDSMTGDGILDGDLVVIDPGQDPADGDIAVLSLDWEDQATGLHRTHRTIKRLRDEGTLLESSNPANPPVPVPPGVRTRVWGRAIAVLATDGATTVVTPLTGGAPYKIPRVRVGQPTGARRG